MRYFDEPDFEAPDFDHHVIVQVDGVTTVYASLEELLDTIQVNWDVLTVCLQFQGKVRWIYRYGPVE